MKDLFLIYVHDVGVDSTGKNIYEFLFNDNLEDEVSNTDWDFYPASAGSPIPPHERFIKEIGRLETREIKLDVIQRSDTFTIFDGLDKIVAMAYEDINSYEVYPKKRLGFSFGETLQEVKDKLYEKDLILEFKYEKINKKIN